MFNQESYNICNATLLSIKTEQFKNILYDSLHDLLERKKKNTHTHARAHAQNSYRDTACSKFVPFKFCEQTIDIFFC